MTSEAGPTPRVLSAAPFVDVGQFVGAHGEPYHVDDDGDELLELAEDAARMELYAEAEEIARRVHQPELSPEAGQRLAMLNAVVVAHRGGES